MGWLNKKGQKEGVWIESTKTGKHKHKDGSSGKDVKIRRNIYKDGKLTGSSKATGWSGKGHTKE